MLYRLDSPDLSLLAVGGSTLWLLEAIDMSEDGQTVLVRATFTDDADGGATLHYGLWLYDLASNTYTLCFNSLLAGEGGFASDYEVVSGVLSQRNGSDVVVLESRLRGASGTETLLSTYENGALTSPNLLGSFLGLEISPRIEGYSLSEDGRFLAIQTDSAVLASELSPDTNESSDIYLVDLRSKTVERVSFVGGIEVFAPVTLGGLTVVGSVISVAFTSSGAFASGDTNSGASTESEQRDAYVWQMQFNDSGFTGSSSIALVSKTSVNTASGMVTDGKALVTATGVFFESESGSLVANDFNDTADVFFRDQNGLIQRIEPTGLAELSTGASLAGASADGSKVLLLSNATELVGETGIQQLVVVNVATMGWEVVSSNAGILADDWVIDGIISPDGEGFAFSSTATNLDVGAASALTGDLFLNINTAPALALVQTVDFTEDAAGNAVGAVVATYTTTDKENSPVTVMLSDTTNYALGTGADAGKVLLTEAGLALVNSGQDLPSFTLTPNDGKLDGTTATVDPAVMAVNDAPLLTSSPVRRTFINTRSDDTFSSVSGDLSAVDAEYDDLTFGILGGTTTGDTATQQGTYGSLSVNITTGAWAYFPDDGNIESIASNSVDTFTVTVSDGTQFSSQALTVHLINIPVTTAKYFVLAGSGANYIDYQLDAGDINLQGQYTIQVGTSGVDAIHVRPDSAVDFTLSGASADKIYLDGNYAEYVFNLSGSLMTMVRSSGNSDEIVRFTKGTNLTNSDLLIFADGSVSSWDLFNFLKDGVELPALGSETSLNPLTPAVPGSSLSARVKAFSLDSTGETFMPVGPGMNLITVGGIGVDRVYVGEGSSVDATLLGANTDLIYFQGNWSDYSKNLSGSLITFTRQIDGAMESVKVVGSTGALNDKLIFSDGAVMSNNAKLALQVDANMAIHAITTYDALTTTPMNENTSVFSI